MDSCSARVHVPGRASACGPLRTDVRRGRRSRACTAPAEHVEPAADAIGADGTKQPISRTCLGSEVSYTRRPPLKYVANTIVSLLKVPGRFSWRLCGPKRPPREQ